jgi:branched-chain amino acid transport system ATP-binding protein
MTFTNNASPLLEVRDLVKNYGGLRVTDHVNLSLQANQIHALIGPNGAGKTSLVNQIVGEVHHDAGNIILKNQDISHWSVAKRARAGLGRSYQINSIIPNFTALENVLLAVQTAQGHNFHFWHEATKPSRLVERSDEVLDLLNLLPLRQQRASDLSYGQQRQIELAMAVASQPDVLLLDEPMAGLGTTETQHMIEVLQGLRQRFAILLIEHDMHAVFSLADRVSVLVYGQVVLCDTPNAVRQSAVVREAYLGEEALSA